MTRSTPEWFKLCDEATSQMMRRIADAVSANEMTLQVKSAPLLAHWFILDTLLLANQANRDGMHANALALTRQCVEAIGVIELGICGHSDAEAMLLKWEADELTAGKLRAWLQAHVWPNLWDWALERTLVHIHARIRWCDPTLCTLRP